MSCPFTLTVDRCQPFTNWDADIDRTTGCAELTLTFPATSRDARSGSIDWPFCVSLRDGYKFDPESSATFEAVVVCGTSCRTEHFGTLSQFRGSLFGTIALLPKLCTVVFQLTVRGNLPHQSISKYENVDSHVNVLMQALQAASAGIIAPSDVVSVLRKSHDTDLAEVEPAANREEAHFIATTIESMRWHDNLCFGQLAPAVADWLETALIGDSRSAMDELLLQRIAGLRGRIRPCIVFDE